MALLAKNSGQNHARVYNMWAVVTCSSLLMSPALQYKLTPLTRTGSDKFKITLFSLTIPGVEYVVATKFSVTLLARSLVRDSHVKGAEMLIKKFELNSYKGDQSGRGSSFI